MAMMVGFSVKDGGVTGAMRQLLKQLLERKLVDAVLVPLELPSRENVVQSLVTRAEVLDAADPAGPGAAGDHGGNIISKITRLASSQKKVAVVARPCELRALIELVKLKQASLNNIVLVGVDCYGTYSVPDYKQFGKGNQAPGDEFMKGARAGQADSRLREACQICEYPYPLLADITVGLIGTDFNKEIVLLANTPAGEQLVGGLGLPEARADGRQAAIDKLVAERR